MRRILTTAIAAFLVAAVPAAEAEPVKSGNPVFDRVGEIVTERFYDPSRLAGFDRAVARIVAEHPDLAGAPADSAVTAEAIDRALASLGASHTARYTADTVEYYELIDVFRFGLRRELRRLFAPNGEVAYDGIGIATARIDGRTFVSDVYDGGPADEAGLLAGDEIVSVDGEPFAPIASFRGKAGGTAELLVRRADGAEPIGVSVSVKSIQPGETFLEAISSSVGVSARGNRRVGTVRIWAYTRGDEVNRILAREIGGGRFKDVDGIVLDLRGRWGGAPADAAEIFVGRSASMRMIGRSGEVTHVNERWTKPVVAIIDEGSRSGMEVLAHSLKKNGIPLVGTRTAGHVVAGTAFLLPDDSLLILAVADVLVDDARLEGHPVVPDVEVPFALPYAGGRDPQMDEALARMDQRLGEMPSGD